MVARISWLQSRGFQGASCYWYILSLCSGLRQLRSWLDEDSDLWANRMVGPLRQCTLGYFCEYTDDAVTCLSTIDTYVSVHDFGPCLCMLLCRSKHLSKRPWWVRSTRVAWTVAIKSYPFSRELNKSYTLCTYVCSSSFFFETFTGGKDSPPEFHLNKALFKLQNYMQRGGRAMRWRSPFGHYL
jgi:hypothetical protein